MQPSRLFAGLVLSCALSLTAQTYTPKAIRLQGAEEMNQADIMRLVDLKPGAAVTKEQIEAAMQRLADSGLFADLSYKVDSTALVIVVKPIAEAQSQPVRYSNFIWWSPGQLEPLVEARVPLFHGKLPLTGQLTTAVEAALVALLTDKGVPGAKVEAMQSTLGGGGLALTITQPQITLGQVHLSGVAPEAADQMNRVAARLAARDFDIAETPRTIENNTLDTHRNAGYLDAVADAPLFSAPRKDMQGYAVDATETVHPGALYHIAAMSFTGVDPKLEPEMAKASGLKVGDPAGQMTVRIAAGLAARALSGKGNLEAKATAQVTKDTAAHTATYAFTLVPGPVYNFAAVDTASLSTEAQRRFAEAFHATPGVIADSSVTRQLVQGLQAAGVAKTVVINSKLDRSAHTVIYVIVSKTAVGTASEDPEENQP